MSDTEVPPGPPPATHPATDNDDKSLIGHALDEVQLLIDFVSGRPDKNLSSLELVDPVNRNNKLFADDVLKKIAEIRFRANGDEPTTDADLSFILLAKDALAGLASPARSLTIAYTQLFVAAALRKRLWLRVKDFWNEVIRRRNGNRGNSDSYSGLAIRAFPTLQGHARIAHIWYLIWIWFTIFFIVFAAGVYWDVSFGNSILDRVSSLNDDRAKILEQSKDAETVCRDKSQTHATAAPPAEVASIANVSTPAQLVSTENAAAPATCAASRLSGNTCETPPTVCPPPPAHHIVHHVRPAATQTIIVECAPPKSLTPGPEPVSGPGPAPLPVVPPVKADPPPCDRLFAIDADKNRAHGELLQLVRCEGTSCSVPLHVLPWSLVIDDGFFGLNFTTKLLHFLLASPQTDVLGALQLTSRSDKPVSFVEIDAIDKSVSSLFKIYSTYILPLIFGVLGTLVGAIRDVRNKIKDSELAPRDVWMFLIGLPMGAVAGLVVGLFLSPTDVTIPGMSVMSGKLSLSATALGFLAGYGSESFFTFVDSVFKQLFRATKT